tara:strand:- start:3422 stop:4813 length:1392 start_codon:yes stop_codon:yes gene_type:complete
MASKKSNNKKLQDIPSVDEIISYYKEQMTNAPYNLYIQVIRKTLNKTRQDILNNVITGDVKKYIFNLIEKKISIVTRSNLQDVINGTGIILHTGLGRAPISKKIMQNAMENIIPYTNIELDLLTGKRGERTNNVIDLINSLTGSESALVVNNNAAAVLLMLNTLSEGKKVIISRGEQVEIGGSFRIPDVIKKSGCKMVEVGTTNKTHLEDYSDAIDSETGAIMVAHTSNYKVMGFTHSVSLSDLGLLARKKRIPLLVDLGCGAVSNFSELNLPSEPSVFSYVKSASGIFSFSGDKLLGGPQAGIICGKKTLINRLHKNPLYRALRCDKLTYAILEETLRTYLTPIKINKDNLTMFLFQRNPDKLKKVAENILSKISNRIIKKYGIEIRLTEVEAGSGSMPLEKLSSCALVFRKHVKPTELSKKFRNASTPVLGYIKGNKFYIDLKAIPSNQEKILYKTLQEVL